MEGPRQVNPGFQASLGIGDMIVMVVEDEEHTALMLQDLIGREVFSIQWSATLRDARQMLVWMNPDLIILDRNLPDGDGAELCRELKLDVKTQSIPVLFLTGRPTDPSKSGGDDYLPKPFTAPELLRRAQRLLRGRGGTP